MVGALLWKEWVRISSLGTREDDAGSRAFVSCRDATLSHVTHSLAVEGEHVLTVHFHWTLPLCFLNHSLCVHLLLEDEFFSFSLQSESFCRQS